MKLDTKAEVTSVEDITTRVHAIETVMHTEQPSLNNINLSPQKQSTVITSVNEMEDHDRRKRNVLVFGLKEENDNIEDVTTDKTNFENCAGISTYWQSQPAHTGLERRTTTEPGP